MGRRKGPMTKIWSLLLRGYRAEENQKEKKKRLRGNWPVKFPPLSLSPPPSLSFSSHIDRYIWLLNYYTFPFMMGYWVASSDFLNVPFLMTGSWIFKFILSCFFSIFINQGEHTYVYVLLYLASEIQTLLSLHFLLHDLSFDSWLPNHLKFGALGNIYWIAVPMLP